jgi:hypothetical protein
VFAHHHAFVDFHRRSHKQNHQLLRIRLQRSGQRSKKTSVKYKNYIEEQAQSEKLDFSNNNSSNLVNFTKQNLEDLT